MKCETICPSEGKKVAVFHRSPQVRRFTHRLLRFRNCDSIKTLTWGDFILFLLMTQLNICRVIDITFYTTTFRELQLLTVGLKAQSMQLDHFISTFQ